MPPRTIRLYALAIGISKIGTGLFFLVNTWLMIDITGRASSAAISLLMTVLPGILVSPFLGVLIDRGRPARLAVAAEGMRWMVLVAWAATYRAGLATAALGCGVSFLVALGNELQTMAWRAALARNATPAQMFRLNALTVVGGQTGQIVGAAASGFALAAFGATATVLLTGAMFLSAGALGLLVARRLDGPARTGVPRARGPRAYARELGAGFEHLAQRPEIVFFYALIVANLTVIFGINGMLAPFVREELRLGPEAFGKIDAGYAFGAIVGGLAVVRLSARLGQRAVLLASFAMASASLWTFAHATGIAAAAVAYAGLGLAYQANVISLSVAQQVTDPAFQGRVTASFSLLSGLVGLGLYLLIAACVGHHWLRQFYVAQAVAMLCLCALVATMTRRLTLGRLLRPSLSAAPPGRVPPPAPPARRTAPTPPPSPASPAPPPSHPA